MSDRWMSRGDEPTETEWADVLRMLDPATDDPNYWFRFRAWVVESAGPELARRRLIADVTVGDVLNSWARTLVPSALLAAAAAGILLLREPPVPAQAPISIQEMLVSDLGDEEPIPPAEASAAILFASERF